jgi:hypothetical protein
VLAREGKRERERERERERGSEEASEQVREMKREKGIAGAVCYVGAGEREGGGITVNVIVSNPSSPLFFFLLTLTHIEPVPASFPVSRFLNRTLV